MAVTVRLPSVNVAASTSLEYLMERLHVRESLQVQWPSLVFVQFAQDGGPNAWKEIPVKKGMKIVFWRAPLPAADYTALAASADDPAAKALSAAVVSGTASEYGNQIIVTDWSLDTPIVPSLEVAVQNLSEMAGRTFNGLIGGAISAGGTAKFARLSADSNKVSATTVTKLCKLTKRGLEELRLYLAANNIRPYMKDGFYKYALHPSCVKDLRGEATAVVGYNDFIAQSGKMTTGEARGWEVGNLCGFKLIETTELASVISSSMSAGDSTTFGFYNLWAGHESVGATSLAGRHLPHPPAGAKTPRQEKMQRWDPRQMNIKIMLTPPGGAGQHDPMKRRGIAAYKFNCLVKVLLAAACGYHFCGSANSSTGVANGA